MSEYKFACPVCGQHMMCDSSQGGTVMECPTCFQKITAPQAPTSEEQKFILAGQKFVANKPPTSVLNAAAQPGIPVGKKFPIWIVMVLLAFLAAASGIYFFGGQSFNGNPSHPGSASGWQSGDIGDAGAAGSFSETNGTFTLNGSGADIWHQADGFHYVYQALKGDGMLAAQVLNLKKTDEWAKAGVMIRETTGAGSVFALASIRADGQAQFIWRGVTGGEAEASGLAGGTGYPKWVKITRSGNSFSAYYKETAGDAWQQLGSPQTIGMSPDTEIGLIVCAHNAGIMCQAQFDNVTLQGGFKAGSKAAHTAPKLVAPPAEDTNWTLNLDTVTNLPDATAAGRIHGRDFICERAFFQNGVLTLRYGTRGPVELGLTINFSGALAEALAGQSINVTTNADTAARVTLRWKDGGQVAKENYDSGYAMRLEFGALANNHIPGKIYFCAPDGLKSYVMGNFTVDVRKPKPKAPKSGSP